MTASSIHPDYTRRSRDLEHKDMGMGTPPFPTTPTSPAITRTH